MDLHISRDFPEGKIRVCPGCFRSMPVMMCKCLGCKGHLLLDDPGESIARPARWTVAKSVWEA
eukprot:5381050-Lingulodinium_polyedra.AAC.1